MSVNEMNKVVNNLIDCGLPYMDMFDVFYSVTDLREKLAALNEMYSTGTYEDSELADAKNNCNLCYIRLEYALCFLKQPHDTYRRRVECAKYYNDILSFYKKNSVSKTDIINVIELMGIMTRLKALSRTCEFTADMLTDETITAIKKVTGAA